MSIKNLKDLVPIKISLANGVMVDLSKNPVEIKVQSNFVKTQLKSKYSDIITNNFGRNVKFVIGDTKKRYASIEWRLKLFKYLNDNYPLDFFGKKTQDLIQVLAQNSLWVEIRKIRKKWGLPEETEPKEYIKNFKIVAKHRTSRHPDYDFKKFMKKYCSNRKTLSSIPEEFKPAFISASNTINEYQDLLEPDIADPWIKTINELLQQYELNQDYFEIMEYLIICNSFPAGGINNLEGRKLKKIKKNLVRDAVIAYFYSKNIKNYRIINDALELLFGARLHINTIKTAANRQKGYVK